MTHRRAFNSFYCFMIRFANSRSKDLSNPTPDPLETICDSFPISAVDGRKRVKVEKEGIASHNEMIHVI